MLCSATKLPLRLTYSSAIRRWVYARPEFYNHGLTKRRRRFDYRMDSGRRCLLLFIALLLFQGWEQILLYLLI
jgi:hypothetical protein